MNVLRRAAAACFFLVIAAVQAPSSPFFTTIGSRDGLPNSSVSSIVQDRKGFLWFGTQAGLARYDGYSFTLYESEPFERNSLSHNQVQTLYLDGDVLWVGTYGGLDRLDLASGRFSSYRHDPNDASSLSGDLVIAVERDAGGVLWVGTSKGLNRLDEGRGVFKRYRADAADPRSIGSDVVRDIHADRRGTLWVATSGGGLARYAPDTDDFDRIVSRPNDPASLPSDYVMSIDEADDGSLWFGLWFFGVSRLADESALRFESLRLADERVYFVNARSPGRVLAGTWGGGLFDIDAASLAAERRRADDGPGSIAFDVVYSSFYDETGLLWIGTNGGGISRGERSERRYEAFLHDPERPASLFAGKVTAILEDRRGRLWVGGYNGGLSRWEPASGRFVHYRHDPMRKRSLPNDIVNALFECASGELWVCTNEGLARYEEASDDFAVYRNDPADPGSIADNVVYALEDAPGGDLWVGTYTKGLDRWDRASGSFIHFPPDQTGAAGPTDALVYALEYDARGRLWVGLNIGLNRMEEGRFVGYRYDPDDRKGLSADTIRNLYRDSAGRLWLGSVGGGLMRYEAESDSFVHFTKRDGLPNNTVRSILEADDGSLWVGTATGLGVIAAQGAQFRGYSVYNDLKDRDFHTGACRTSDGKLHFGGMNAVYRIDPSAEREKHRRPRLVVTELKSGDAPVSAERLPAYIDSLRLPYDKNNLTVSYSAVDYRDPARNLYSRKLEGFDEDWSLASYDRTVSYANLPGGTYRLLVRVSDSEGYWNEEALVLPVRVDSPPWATPWAFFLYLCALVGLGYLSASLRGKRALGVQVRELTRLKTELEEANTKLSDLSLIDGLTGIGNRRRLDISLPRIFAEASRERAPVSVLMLDLDFFKNYNDRYGHLKGDEALKSVARTIQDSVERATDLVARFGGEEFVAVLPHTDEQGAFAVAERIRRRVEELGIATDVSPISDRVTLSLGAVTAELGSGVEPAALLDAADAALYRAKSEGRNRTVSARAADPGGP